MAMMLMFLAILSAVSWASVNGRGNPDIAFESSETLKPGDSCQTPVGGAGICKEISMCEPYVKRKIKYSTLSRCAFIGDQEITCCPTSETDSTPSITTKRSVESPASTTPLSVVISRNGDERPSEAACRTWKSIDRGTLPSHTADSITVSPGDYPHMGGFIFSADSEADMVVRCGASLISERYVLTSAQCVEGGPTMVRFGVDIWDPKADDSMVPVDVEIENITTHSEHKPPLIYHDIALIRLRNPIQFTSFVRPACLYTDMNDVDSNTPLEVLSWGETNDKTQTSSEVLLMTNASTVRLNDCNATYLNLGVQRSFKFGLKEEHYCAVDAELNKDNCHEDSGSPLQLVEDKYSTIIGIASFGLSCSSVAPSVYTRVAYYLNWIESIVWPS